MNQDATQESVLLGGNGGNTTTSFTTGATVPSSGTYRSDGKYMDIIAVLVVGDKFGPDATGKKCTWVALTSNTSTNKEGSFTSVKVEAGAV